MDIRYRESNRRIPKVALQLTDSPFRNFIRHITINLIKGFTLSSKESGNYSERKITCATCWLSVPNSDRFYKRITCISRTDERCPLWTTNNLNNK